jgi:GDP-L-fucose synthase
MIQSNVIHACWKYGVKKLLFLGSTCIYPKNAPQPLKEEYLLTSPLEYTNEPYAIAKIAGLKTCESFNIQYGTDFIAVMPTNLYGAGDNYDLEKSHVLPALMRKIHLGKCLEKGDREAVIRDLKKNPVEGLGEDPADDEIITVLGKSGVEARAGFRNGIETESAKEVVVSVWGTGSPYREFMYSEDMARACIYIMEKVSASDIANLHRTGRENDFRAPHFINIGTGEEITIRDLAYRIKELTGFRGEIVFDASRPDGTMRKATDIRILRNLGFRHRYSLDAGLREVYDKYLKDQELL